MEQLASIILFTSHCGQWRTQLFVRPSRRPSRRRRPFSVRPSCRVPSCLIVAVAVLCPFVRAVVAVRLLSVRPRPSRRRRRRRPSS